MKQITFSDTVVTRIEQTLGYRFSNRGLLVQAFTRSSFHNEHPDHPDNEVLELIGDSVLSLSVLTHFEKAYASVTERGLLTDWNEGNLSAFKHSLVNKRHLAACMRPLQLHPYLLLSRGDMESDVTSQDSVLEDLFESLIGAIYVDSGNDFEVASKVVGDLLDLDGILDQSRRHVSLSHRNDLQEWCQDRHRRFEMPSYRTRELPDGQYEATVEIRELSLTESAIGKNTKQACERAAEQMLARIRVLPAEALSVSRQERSENYVGRLQELLQRRSLPLSSVSYASLSERIDANGDKLFSVRCRFQDKETIGEAPSKQKAKQRAACEMLEYLER